MEMTVSASSPLPACRIRLGSFSEDFVPTQILLNGRESLSFTEELIEGRKWIWVHLEPQQAAQGFTLTVQ